MALGVRKVVLKLLALGLGGYLLVCGALFALQRAMVFPRPKPIAASASHASLVTIPGQFPTVALYAPAPEGRLTVVRFHGNGSQLASDQWLVSRCRARGLGYFAVEYPGYGLAPGEPTEESILSAVEAGVLWLEQSGVRKDQMILFGQSLGTGPALYLASRGWGRAVILGTPYTSISDVGARHFPWLPVRALLRDRFPAVEWGAEVKQPTLVFHGTADEVIPFDIGAAQARSIPSAKLIVLKGVGHNTIWDQPGMLERALTFGIEAKPRGAGLDRDG